MDELKIGDVVYFNSKIDLLMTVTFTSPTSVQCMYYDIEKKTFKYTPEIPKATVTKYEERSD